MRKVRILNALTKVSDLTFAEFDESNETRQQKAQALQKRCWRTLKHATKNTYKEVML